MLPPKKNRWTSQPPKATRCPTHTTQQHRQSLPLIDQATIGNRQQTQDETHHTHHNKVKASSFVDVRTIQQFLGSRKAQWWWQWNLIYITADALLHETTHQMQIPWEFVGLNLDETDWTPTQIHGKSLPTIYFPCVYVYFINGTKHDPHFFKKSVGKGMFGFQLIVGCKPCKDAIVSTRILSLNLWEIEILPKRTY